MVMNMSGARVILFFVLLRHPVPMDHRGVIVLMTVVVRSMLELAERPAGMVMRNVIVVVPVHLRGVGMFLLLGLAADGLLLDAGLIHLGTSYGRPMRRAIASHKRTSRVIRLDDAAAFVATHIRLSARVDQFALARSDPPWLTY